MANKKEESKDDRRARIMGAAKASRAAYEKREAELAEKQREYDEKEELRKAAREAEQARRRGET